ncbi:unnamed protein product [Mytilus edulis]|uniref:STING ligand-binding domain-containing protein n=1 Tax=Mytilus edulis TaxID=6550 RepID=A0A8S3QBX0_MYTED|nr:unnamed protein product [Mytilus edulis]
MQSFLCIKIKEEDVRENARLLLFHGLDKKPSDVLLHAIKEDLKINKSEQKINGSLMENKLLYADEMNDIVYDFDVFVTHPEKVTDKEDLNKINKKLKHEKMKVLLEKDCLGQDWLEKIRFAATKCRSEVKLKNAQDLYPKPGEAAVGLAWGYAVNYLNKAIPDMKEEVATIKETIDKGITFPDKLFIVVPESCQAEDKLEGITLYTKTKPSSNSLKSFEFSVYELDKSTVNIFMFC